MKKVIYTVQTPSMPKSISIIRDMPYSIVLDEVAEKQPETLATVDLTHQYLHPKSCQEFMKNSQTQKQLLIRSHSTPSKSPNNQIIELRKSQIRNSPIVNQVQSFYKLSEYTPGRISSHQPPVKTPPSPPIIHIEKPTKKSPFLTAKDLRNRNIITNAPYSKTIQPSNSSLNVKIVNKFEKKILKKKDISEKNKFSDFEVESDDDDDMIIPTPNLSPIKSQIQRGKTNTQNQSELSEKESENSDIIIPPTPFTFTPRFLPSNPNLVVVGGLIYEKSEYYSFPMTEKNLTKEERALKYCVTPTKWNQFIFKKISQNPTNKKMNNKQNNDDFKIVVVNGKEYKKFEYKTIPLVENHMTNEEKYLKYKIPPKQWNKMVRRKLNTMNLSSSKISDLIEDNDILYVDESQYDDGILTPISNTHFNDSFTTSNSDNDGEEEVEEYIEIDGFIYNKKDYKTVEYVENNLTKDEKSLKYKIPPNEWNKLIRYKLSKLPLTPKQKQMKKIKQLMKESEDLDEENGEELIDNNNNNNILFQTPPHLHIGKSKDTSPESPLVTIHGMKYKKSLYKNNPLLENMLSEEEKKLKYKITPSKWNKMLSSYIIELENKNEEVENEILNNNESIISTPIQTTKSTNKSENNENFDSIPPWEYVTVKGKKYSKKDYINDPDIEKLLSLQEKQKKYTIKPDEWRIFLTIKRSEIIKSIKRQNNNNIPNISSPLRNEIIIIDNYNDDDNYLSDSSSSNIINPPNEPVLTPTKVNTYVNRKILNSSIVYNNKKQMREDVVIPIESNKVIVNGIYYDKCDYNTYSNLEKYLNEDEKKLKYHISPSDWIKILLKKRNEISEYNRDKIEKDE